MCDSGGQLEIQGKNQYVNNQRDPLLRGCQDVVAVFSGRLNKTVRFYDDGVKVGCTFVTNEALEAILAMRRTA
jgi:hypothetical protein